MKVSWQKRGWELLSCRKLIYYSTKNTPQYLFSTLLFSRIMCTPHFPYQASSEFPRLNTTMSTHTLLGPLGSPNKRRGSDWGTPIGFSQCVSAQCSLFSGVALGNINLARFAEQGHYHYLNWPSGGKVDHVCWLHKTASLKTKISSGMINRARVTSDREGGRSRGQNTW